MSLIKSKKRVVDHGEVFTPPWMVDAMLDLVKEEADRIDSRFLEPACGSGNFLIRVLQRKMCAVEIKFGTSFRCNRKTRMHQKSAYRTLFEMAVEVASDGCPTKGTNFLWLGTLISKLTGVLKNQSHR